MEKLINVLLEDISDAAPEAYNYDPDMLVASKESYIKFIDRLVDEYEDKIRNIALTINPALSASNTETEALANYAKPCTDQVEPVGNAVNHAHLECGNDFETCVNKTREAILLDFSKRMSIPENACIEEITKSLIQKYANKARTVSLLPIGAELMQCIYYTITLVHNMADRFKEYDKLDTPLDYQKHCELFKSVVHTYCQIAKVFVCVYANLAKCSYYNSCAKCTDNVQKLNRAVDVDMNRMADADRVQNKYIGVHGIPNRELANRAEILNEKYVKDNELYMNALKKSTESINEAIDTLIEDINCCRREMDNFYNTYDKKEFLNPVAVPVDRQYAENIVTEKFPLASPVFKINTGSTAARECIQKECLPKMIDIANNHNFVLKTTRIPVDTESYLLYLSRPQPMNEATKIYTYDQYVTKPDGRLTAVYTPDGEFVGNAGYASEISEIIRDDITERRMKAEEEERKAKANNESAELADEFSSLLEETLSAAERREMHPNEFGLPEKKQYPLNDIGHIRKAIQFFGYCKYDSKATLARNIEKAIVKLNLVGQVTVGKNHPGRKYFHQWMLDGENPIVSKEGNSFTITLDGKQVDSGTFETTSDEPITESAIKILI